MNDVYASFGTVDLTRFEVLDRVVVSLKARFDADFFELERVNGSFEYTHREFDDLSIWNGVKRSADWKGVEFHLTLFERSCGMLLLNLQPARTTVILMAPGGLMNDQVDDPQLEARFVGLLAEWVNALGTGFCVIEPGWTGKERESSDIDAWAQDILGGKERDWIHVLLADAPRAERIAPMVSTRYDRRVCDGLTWFARQRIQSPAAMGGP